MVKKKKTTKIKKLPKQEKEDKKEMDWRILFIIIAIIVIIFSTAAIVIMSRWNDWVYGEINETNKSIKLVVVTEKELYARLEAEFLCQYLEAESAGDKLSLLSNFPELADEHGYTLREVEELREKYDKNEEFLSIALNETKNLCPLKIEAANITKFNPHSPSYHET